MDEATTMLMTGAPVEAGVEGNPLLTRRPPTQRG